MPFIDVRSRGLASSTLALVCACAPTAGVDTPVERPAPRPDTSAPNPASPKALHAGDLDAFPADPRSTARVCARGPSDSVGRRLCASPNPSITGLLDLHRAVGLGEDAPHRQAVANAYSTSLAARQTSSLNPRVIVFDVGQPGDPPRAAGFARGEPVVELVGVDAGGGLHFYIVRFDLPCGDACGPEDLLGPSIETGWTRWSLYQDVDLVNSPIDCLVCHQPDGPSTPKMGRMQELRAPWLHYFPASGMGLTESVRVLQPRFRALHGGEVRFGGVRVDDLTEVVDGGAQPRIGGANTFETFVDALGETADHPGGDSTALELQAFASETVEAERAAGSRATWMGYRRQVLRGERIPIPHFAVDPSDDARRARAEAWYRAAVIEGRRGLPVDDPRELFTPETDVELSRAPSPDEDGPTLIRHFCARCHNGRLDQTLTRARFDATALDALDDTARATAAARVELPDDAPGLMPPPRFATLPAWARRRIVEALSR